VAGQKNRPGHRDLAARHALLQDVGELEQV
jgi:hypothetical protein